MVLKNLINKSIYGGMGYISSQNDIDLLKLYIIHNLPVLKEFKQIIVATNYGSSLQEENAQMWKEYFPNCILIDSKLNRGHNHGYIDLENLIFDWCKENNEEWLCKVSNDVIFKESILDKQIEEADFYYLNGIGIGGMVKYDFNFDRIINENFYPQGNFYILNISKCDFIGNKTYIDETYNYVQSLSNYNGKIWEYIEGWTCENFLKQCIERNNLIKYHLIPEEKYRILLQIVRDNRIHDCSHKNIMVEGICHLQYSNQQIIKI
jgi:hypothetical protein